MEHAEVIAGIKKEAGKIKALLDKADATLAYAPQAIANANVQLERVYGELARLETTLKQFTSTPAAVKMGPSETK